MLLNCKGLLRSDPRATLGTVRGEQIVILTETWLGEDDTPPPLSGYTAYNFPRPRNGRVGGPTRGGVVVYLSCDLAAFVSTWQICWPLYATCKR